MNIRPNILVACGRNKRRSRTAEHLFKNDSRFNIRSVGLSSKSERVISEKDIEWSDYILVMEDGHGARITGMFRNYDLEIEVLHIPDEYEYLDPELIKLLESRINATLKIVYGI